MNRYENTKIYSNNGNPFYGITKYPKIPLRYDDLYIYSTISDRLDILALTHYQDKTLWWVIAVANNIPKDSFNIPPGIQIRIPQNIQNILYRFKVINNR